MDRTQAERYAGIALIVLGVLFYGIFGILRGAILDVGVYAITIVPIVIGIGLLWRISQPDANHP